MFDFIKKKVTKVYQAFTKKLSLLFSQSALDEIFLKELSDLLISADVGVKTTREIIAQLGEGIASKKIISMSGASAYLEQFLIDQLKPTQISFERTIPRVILLVGVNGSGKTTFASKLAHRLKSQGSKVMLIAGDTFRAAGMTQLEEWGKQIGITVFAAQQGQDPASVIFDGCKRFEEGHYDQLIIDTAGRLQSKINLMRELEKVKKVVERKLPNKRVATLLVVDAMIGQNSFAQAKAFHEATKLDGIVVSKLDGTGKGGIVFSIAREFSLPVVYITYGERVEDIALFNPEEFVRNIMSE